MPGWRKLLRTVCCRTGIRHHWAQRSTEDGDRYWRCERCGKDRFQSVPHWISGANG